jgi:hypothetical protein
MKLFIVLLAFTTFLPTAKSQVLVANMNDTNYVVNRKLLTAGDKKCLTINIFSKYFIEFGNGYYRPLLFLKIFDPNAAVKINSIPKSAITIEEFMKRTVLPVLGADMNLSVFNLESGFKGSNSVACDSFYLFDGTNYEFLGGTLIIDFFNQADFPQQTVQQTNQTILNTKATLVNLAGWTQDSVPIVKITGLNFSKIYLIAKTNLDFTFSKYASLCSHCQLNFYNEYVFRKDYGIIAFRSKYFKRKPDARYDPPYILTSTNEYFSFK